MSPEVLYPSSQNGLLIIYELDRSMVPAQLVIIVLQGEVAAGRAIQVCALPLKLFSTSYLACGERKFYQLRLRLSMAAIEIHLDIQNSTNKGPVSRPLKMSLART